jgi:hypothetical protein
MSDKTTVVENLPKEKKETNKEIQLKAKIESLEQEVLSLKSDLSEIFTNVLKVCLENSKSGDEKVKRIIDYLNPNVEEIYEIKNQLVIETEEDEE